MKVYVVTDPENGWDCVSGVYLDIDTMLNNYKTEDNCEITYKSGKIFNGEDILENLVVHEKNINCRQFIYGIYNNTTQNYNCYFNTLQKAKDEINGLFKTFEKVEGAELLENGLKLNGNFVYTIHPIVLN